MSSQITSASNIRVIWKDKMENYSKERVKEIKNHVKNKYKTNLVRVDFHATNKINIGLTDLTTGDVENINRPETQEKIILQYLTDNNVDITVEDIKRLNKKVEAELTGFSEAKDNVYSIKTLVIENFLAFGDKIELNLEDLKGITLINGDNFAGKTSLIIDSIRFLLFNNTSKTKTADEVINRFRDLDFGRVSGELVIDNVEYKIEREVLRKWKKDKSSYSTSTNLNFYKKDENGEFELINDEQRGATDKVIRENIGNEKEFLMTVLCTGKNLFDIIEAKPTERGQVLSKFLGLEIFERKEEIAKKMYTTWKTTTKLGRYSSVELQNTINLKTEEVENNSETLVRLNGELDAIIVIKSKLIEEKQEYLTFYHNDIDTNMSNVNEQFYINKIDAVQRDIDNKTVELATIKGTYIENIEQFDTVGHNLLLEDINSKKVGRSFKESEIKDIQENQIKLQYAIRDKEGDNRTITRELERLRKVISDLKSGKNCPTCGQVLKDVDHSLEIKNYIAEGVKEKAILDGNLELVKGLEAEIQKFGLEILIIQSHIGEIDGEITLVKAEVQKLLLVKDKIVANDMTGLKIDKVEVEIESLGNKKIREEDNLKKYRQDLFKIEKNKELDEKIRLKSIDITQQDNCEVFKRREITSLESLSVQAKSIIDENTVLLTTIKKEEHFAKVFDTYIAMVGKNGISKTILKNTVPVLNIELAKLMADTAEFTVSIEINEKNNEVEFWMIDNKTDVKAYLSSGSGYETTVGALGLRIVLSKVNTLPKPSMLLIDEIFGTVTNNNLELIKIFIDKISESIDNIFMITHNEFVKEWANKIITVVKTDNVSIVK